MPIKSSSKVIVKGPKTGQLSAKFNSQAKKQFAEIKSTKVLSLLSIKNNKYCTNEYLGAIVEHAISNYGFTTFLIADTVYWHNLKTTDHQANSENEQQLSAQAEIIGSEYFETNLVHFLKPIGLTVEKFNNDYPCDNSLKKIEMINKLAKDKGLQFEIVTWKQWLNKSEAFFNQYKDYIESLYKIDPLKSAIDESAQEYSERHVDKIKIDYNLLNQRSKDYLLEESPRIILIALLHRYNFIVYPGEMITCLEKTKEVFSQPDIQEKLSINMVNQEYANWLTIVFTRKLKKNDSPVSFENKATPTLFCNNQVLFPANFPSDFIKAAVSGFTQAVSNSALLKSDDNHERQTERLIEISAKFSLTLFHKLVADNLQQSTTAPSKAVTFEIHQMN